MRDYIDETFSMAKIIWQGRQIDIQELALMVDEMVQEIHGGIPKWKGMGIDFPTTYITDAVEHMKYAIDQRDDYLLADNIMYEWREIAVVLDEIRGIISDGMS